MLLLVRENSTIYSQAAVNEGGIQKKENTKRGGLSPEGLILKLRLELIVTHWTRHLQKKLICCRVLDRNIHAKGHYT